ncbi:MAG: metalloregulator ArsR/SmtB family transcription factor [Clostridiales bacterium]|nr:metalloregulator ArsR/SmtB family transcription factor [Clostridiales bacterium]
MENQHDDVCEVSVIHHETVNLVRNAMPDEELVLDAAELFKVFGDSTRAKIICALAVAEMCVCDIAALLNMSSSAISHQLRILKQARIVRSRRDGKIIYYSLDDEHIKLLFDVAIAHMKEEH